MNIDIKMVCWNLIRTITKEVSLITHSIIDWGRGVLLWEQSLDSEQAACKTDRPLEKNMRRMSRSEKSAIIDFFWIHVVTEQAVFGHLGVFAVGAAVIAIRVDGEAAARGEFAPHFDVARIQQGD